MQENQSSGNSCGKACMWTCGGCVVLTILFVVLPMIAISCFGCAACAGMAPMFGGLFQGIANVTKISTYFEDLKTEGWEVDDSLSNQPSGYGAEVESETPMIWKARESADDDWTLYVWTFSADTEAMNRLGVCAMFPAQEVEKAEEWPESLEEKR